MRKNVGGGTKVNEEQRRVILYNAIKDRRIMIYRSVVIFVGLISNEIVMGRHIHDKLVIVCGALVLGALLIVQSFLLDNISTCSKIIKSLREEERQ